MKDLPFAPYAQPANSHAGDRIRRRHSEAIELANRRALKSGRRQQVRVRPPSRFVPSTTFMVQEIR